MKTRMCWDCGKPINMREENHVKRVYVEDKKLTAYFHMQCSDHIQ